MSALEDLFLADGDGLAPPALVAGEGELRDAIARVRDAKAPEVLDALASLVEKSPVQVEGRSAEEVRYRLLESVREYALEQLRLRNELEEARRISLIITTNRLGQFFRETGRPVTGAPLPVTPEDLARFAAVSARYGYWNATPEDNAAVGIPLSSTFRLALRPRRVRCSCPPAFRSGLRSTKHKSSQQ